MEGDESTQHWFKKFLISIHALRVEGDDLAETGIALGYRISIHALRVEGDKVRWALRLHQSISIHALRVEGD